MNNEEKFAYVIKYMGIEEKEIADTFGINKSNISRFKSNTNSLLKTVHLYGMERCFGVPYKIFEDKNITTKSQIQKIIDDRKERTVFDPFIDGKNILNKLIGIWYVYLYPSSKNNELYEIITTINEDYSVYDQNDNIGKLFISDRQSMIIKKSDNSRNLVSITFDNADISYSLFKCSLISKANQSEMEMLSFGFISKKILSKEKAKGILGNIKEQQLQMNLKFKDRISNQVYLK